MTLTLDPQFTPKIGGLIQLLALKAPKASTTGIFAFGVSRTKFGNITLPLSLSAVGMTGCFLHQSSEFPYGVGFANGGSSLVTRIPLNRRLICATFFVQVFVFANQANRAGLLSSNGGAVFIGN